MSFDYLLITAPTQSISNVYHSLLINLKHQLPCLRNTHVLSVADPVDCRVGSGGGTLNALDQLLMEIGEVVFMKSRIAIIHSGGDSRRAPLHSVCGKAWAAVNSLSCGYTSSPMSLLIQEMDRFCNGILPGSAVVAGGDVMLDITKVSLIYYAFESTM